MKKINIISVCGSGTVTSSMIATKVKEFLREHGFNATTIEVSPSGVEGQLRDGKWDIIVHTSPLLREYDLPTLNSVSLMTGMGEEEFYVELLARANELVS